MKKPEITPSGNPIIGLISGGDEEFYNNIAVHDSAHVLAKARQNGKEAVVMGFEGRGGFHGSWEWFI